MYNTKARQNASWQFGVHFPEYDAVQSVEHQLSCVCHLLRRHFLIYYSNLVMEANVPLKCLLTHQTTRHYIPEEGPLHTTAARTSIATVYVLIRGSTLIDFFIILLACNAICGLLGNHFTQFWVVSMEAWPHVLDRAYLRSVSFIPRLAQLNVVIGLRSGDCGGAPSLWPIAYTSHFVVAGPCSGPFNCKRQR